MRFITKRTSDIILYNYGLLRAKTPPFMPKRPMGFFLYITAKCNLNCSYCWQREDEVRKDGWHNSAYEELTADEWVKIIEKLPAKSFVGLTGGESTISPAFYPILSKATERGLPITVNTNGGGHYPRKLLML